MACLYRNGIIELNRGDTVTFPIYINIGTRLCPVIYEMRGCDEPDHGEEPYTDNLYFAIMEPNQRWEDAIVKKTFDYKDFDHEHLCAIVHLYPEDTEYLNPGTYYYQVKLRRDPHSVDTCLETVDTIIDKTKLIILD